MSDDYVCTECGEELEVSQPWLIKDRSKIGQKVTEPISELYGHEWCINE